MGGGAFPLLNVCPSAPEDALPRHVPQGDYSGQGAGSQPGGLAELGEDELEAEIPNPKPEAFPGSLP